MMLKLTPAFPQKFTFTGPCFDPIADKAIEKGNSQNYVYAGLSMRQYYAAKAPAIPGWFQPARKTVRPLTPLAPFTRGSPESAEYASVQNGLLVKDRACKAVQDFCRTLQNVKRAQAEWDAQGECERFFAWRWYFADMMIETEGK